MDSQFKAICRPSAVSTEAWLFRKVFKDGSVVPNALVAADVDDDGTKEILMGSTEGVFAILKPNRRTTLLSMAVPGTVSAVCYQDDTAYIVSMEGVLTVMKNLASSIKGVSHFSSSPTGASATPTPLSPAPTINHVTVPANVTCLAACGDWLVMGASDRKVHLVDLHGYAHIRSYFIGSQVFSVAPFDVHCPSSGQCAPLVFAAGTSHLALIDPTMSDAKDPTVGPCLWTFKIDRGAFACHASPNTAEGGMATDALRIENPALPVSTAALSSTSDSNAFMAAATEDGYGYLFKVHRDNDAPNKCLGSHGNTHVTSVWGTDGAPDSHGGLRLCGGIQRIFMDSSTLDTREQCANNAVIVLSSSGDVNVVDDQKCLARSRLIPNASAFAYMGIGAGDTVSIAAVTTDEISCFNVPCGALGNEGCFGSDSLTRKDPVPGVAFEDLVAVGRVMFPQLSDCSDTFIAQRAMRSLLFGYSAAEWATLREEVSDGI